MQYGDRRPNLMAILTMTGCEAFSTELKKIDRTI